MDVGTDETTLAEVACLMLKVGSLFRVAKVTTGCNLEGYGAGSAAIAAATVHLKNGTPEQMEKAMVLAMSPTIGVPCTPRVLVPALCTAHVGGAILGGMYAGRLCTTVEMTVNVPFDVMFAMASLVHKESAHHIVPTVVEYMEPFFQRTAEVESLVSEEVHKADKKRIEETLEKAKEIAKKMADGSAPIIKTLGDAVVGGSSQAVGSRRTAAASPTSFSMRARRSPRSPSNCIRSSSPAARSTCPACSWARCTAAPPPTIRPTRSPWSASRPTASR